MAKKFRVTAKHVCSDFVLDNAEFIARQSSVEDGWHAIGKGFGCSRDYPTAYEAVLHLVLAQACTSIEIKEVES